MTGVDVLPEMYDNSLISYQLAGGAAIPVLAIGYFVVPHGTGHAATAADLEWTQTTQQVESAARLGSAEVIAEAPSDGTVPPLADFGTVNFTGATVDGAPIGGSANLSELTMESGAGVALAMPSPLTGGSAFAVTFDLGNRG